MKTNQNYYQLSVLGNPVDHSRSPWIHQQFAKQAGVKIAYSKQQVELDKFKTAIANLQNNHFTGCNITMPFKEQACELANELSPAAKLAKAVNTFLFKANGLIVGYNTDGSGLIRDITCNLKYAIKGKRLLILGAGGVVRGILLPLLQQNPAAIVIANRTLVRTQAIVNDFNEYGELQACTYGQLAKQVFDVVIDATSFMGIGELLPTDLKLTADSLCYDLKFPKEPSSFMRWAQQQRAVCCVDGMGMLIEQAADAFEIWTGFRANTEFVITAAKKIYQK